MKKPAMLVALIALAAALSSCALDRWLRDRSLAQESEPDLAGYEALFDPAAVSMMEIRMSQAEWDGLTEDIFAYYSLWGSSKTGARRRADISCSIPGRGDVLIQDAAIRVRGNLSRFPPEYPEGYFNRVHFMLVFDDVEGLDPWSDVYAERKERSFCGLSSLNLKAAMLGSVEEPGDLSLLREQFAYSAYAGAGVKASRTGNIVLSFRIGDAASRNFGPYTAIEPVNKAFLTKRYGRPANDGVLYKCLWAETGPATLDIDELGEAAIGVEDWRGNYFPSYARQLGGGDGGELKDLMERLKDMDDASLVPWLDANFEVDGFLRLTAASVLLGHPDDYWSMANNYYLYFNNRGKLEMFPYDCDNSLGGGWLPFDTANASVYAYHNTAQTFGGQAEKRPLVERILRIPAYLERYEAYIEAFSDPDTGIIAAGSFSSRFDALRPLLSPYLETGTVDGSLGMPPSSADGVEAWMASRRSSAADQLAAGAPWL